MKRLKLNTIAILFLFSFTLNAQTVDIDKDTRIYAIKEGKELRMDIYKSRSFGNEIQPCLIYVFGGGFKGGQRDSEHDLTYFNYFAEKGFTVVSIDYRLGMVGQKAPGLFNSKPIRNAIAMAVEDLYTATNFLLDNHGELNIDPELFIISGSSAGAITVLHADYEDRDNHSSAEVLPDSFNYAGVISFAGGIYSKEGLPSYDLNPAPTMFFHGSADKLVPYNKTRFFRLGMFGTNSLIKRFRNEQYPYVYYSMEGIGHEVSSYPMKDFLPEIEKFINDFVINENQLMIDINYRDLLRNAETIDTPESYYN